MKKVLLLLSCLILFALSLQARPQHEAAGPMRVGLVTAVDCLPILLARDQGFFAQEGVDVEIIVFPNPQDRDAAIQAGRLDGAVNDLLAAAFFTAAGFDFKITSMTNGRFGIVGSPQSKITRMSELKGKRIGVFANTMTQYMADSLLEAAGISTNEYDAAAVPNIPLRLEMVVSGLIDGALLPEPLLTAAVAQGAVLLSTTDGTGLEGGLLFFSKSALDKRLDEVKAFHRAYYRAAMEINANPNAYRSFLVEQAGFPAVVRDTYKFVTYTKPALPGENQIRRALDWLKTRNLLSAELVPADLIDRRAIGEWLN